MKIEAKVLMALHEQDGLRPQEERCLPQPSLDCGATAKCSSTAPASVSLNNSGTRHCFWGRERHLLSRPRCGEAERWRRGSSGGSREYLSGE